MGVEIWVLYVVRRLCGGVGEVMLVRMKEESRVVTIANDVL